MAGMPVSIAVLWDALRREGGVELRSADLTRTNLGSFLMEIRSKGAAAAQQQHASLQGEYAAAYAQYLQLQRDLSPREKTMTALLDTVDEQLRRVIEQAAKYKLQGRQQRMMNNVQDQDMFAAFSEHPKYTAAVAGLNATHREWVDKIVFPYYLQRWQLEEAENALWVKHAAITIAQETYQLWSYEAQAVQMQTANYAEQGAEGGEAYRTQLQRRYLEKRLEEIRRHNKERKKNLREERFLQKQLHDSRSKKSTSTSPNKSERKSGTSRNRSEEPSRPLGSRSRASGKIKDGFSAERDDDQRNRRASSAAPSGSRKSHGGKENKVNPSDWL